MAKTKIYDSVAWLTLKYVTQRMSVEDIAKEAGVAPNTIRTRLKKAGLIK